LYVALAVAVGLAGFLATALAICLAQKVGARCTRKKGALSLVQVGRPSAVVKSAGMPQARAANPKSGPAAVSVTPGTHESCSRAGSPLQGGGEGGKEHDEESTFSTPTQTSPASGSESAHGGGVAEAFDVYVDVVKGPAGGLHEDVDAQQCDVYVDCDD